MEERNEMIQEEEKAELANTEENQTTNVTDDNFGAGLLIGGGAVLLAGVVVKTIKKLRNKHKTDEQNGDRVNKVHWCDRFKKHAEPEEDSDEPVDVEASEVETEEEEE